MVCKSALVKVEPKMSLKLPFQTQNLTMRIYLMNLLNPIWLSSVTVIRLPLCVLYRVYHLTPEILFVHPALTMRSMVIIISQNGTTYQISKNYRSQSPIDNLPAHTIHPGLPYLYHRDILLSILPPTTVVIPTISYRVGRVGIEEADNAQGQLHSSRASSDSVWSTSYKTERMVQGAWGSVNLSHLFTSFTHQKGEADHQRSWNDLDPYPLVGTAIIFIMVFLSMDSSMTSMHWKSTG